MTAPPDLTFTSEQRALVDRRQAQYIEACPGAGKTQVIVQRFIERSQDDLRRGLALLSFTNAVIDETKSRCVGRQDLLTAPNFVGTIDSFINHFIVEPIFKTQTGVRPRFLSTWSQLPNSTVSGSGIRGKFELDWFDYQAGNATLALHRVPVDRRAQAESLVSWQVDRLRAAATAMRQALIARGVMDAAAARSLLRDYVADPRWRPTLLDLLGARFHEVMLDEVQDCCDEDVLLLNLLRDAGIRLVAVGDPDQAIYGFRGASQRQLSALQDALPSGQRLNANFRSSAAICRAVDSLRSSSQARDVAAGRNRHVAQPVLLLSYRRERDVAPQLLSLISSYGYLPSSAVVLAHAAAKARSCAGGGGATKRSDSKLVQIAQAVHAVRDEGNSGRLRHEAVGLLGGLLANLASGGTEHWGDVEYAESLRLPLRSFRERCLRLATGMRDPFSGAPSEFKAQLADWAARLQLDGLKTSSLRTPPNDDWPVRPAPNTSALAHETVHGFKGLQRPVVALVIPEARPGSTDDAVAAWMNGTESEARNVLYVGASRAEEILILVVHEERLSDVRTILTRDAVPLEFVEVAGRTGSP